MNATNPSATEDFQTQRARRTLLASLVIVGMGFSVLFPVLAPLGRELGMSELEITAIIGASSLTVFLSTPIWGRQSDRLGRKPVMLIGLFGFVAGTVLFNTVLHVGLAGWLIGVPLFAALVVARVLHASVMSAAMPAANAYIADITTVAGRTKGMGAAGAANNLGAMLGPAVSGLAVLSLVAPLWVMAGLAFLNGLFVWRYLREPPRQRAAKAGPRMAYTDRRILPFMVVGICLFTGFALVQQTMGFRFQDVLALDAGETARTVGIAMMLSAAASLAAQTLVVQRLDVAPFSLLKAALPLLIVAFAVFATSSSQWLLTGAMMCLGFGMGLAGPGFMAGVSVAVSPEEQGAAAGVAGSCGPLGFTIGPLVGGALYQINPVSPYYLAVVMYVVLLIAMQWLGRRVQQHG